MPDCTGKRALSWVTRWLHQTLPEDHQGIEAASRTGRGSAPVTTRACGMQVDAVTPSNPIPYGACAA
jgi:hypothetical protein